MLDHIYMSCQFSFRQEFAAGQSDLATYRLSSNTCDWSQCLAKKGDIWRKHADHVACVWFGRDHC